MNAGTSTDSTQSAAPLPGWRIKDSHVLLADSLDWDGRGRLLDIGCGSGSMCILLSRRYPCADIVGVDVWDPRWPSTMEVCIANAKEAGAKNVSFLRGDADALDFPDGSFDAAVSNFVFHEVQSSQDKRDLIFEALRVVRKGGAFAFQDKFGLSSLYGDIDELMARIHPLVSELHYVPETERLIPDTRMTGLGIICGRV